MNIQRVSIRLFQTSIGLFVICLALPGFYTGVTREPQASMGLLFFGWLGMMALNFSWLANPLYFLALIKYRNKPETAVILSYAALLMALSFLGYKRIPHDEGGGMAQVTSYGWGFYLWNLSILVLLFSSVAKQTTTNGSKILLTFLLVATFSTLLFVHQFYLRGNSQFSIEQGRKRVLDSLCKSSGEKIYVAVHEPINGIYFDSYGGDSFGKILNGRFGERGSAVHSSRGLKSMAFIEKDAYPKEHPDYLYTREYVDQTLGVVPTNTLESDFVVTSKSLAKDVPPEYWIVAEHVSINKRSTGELIAETTYAASIQESKFCGATHDDRYDTNLFVLRVLNLIE